MHRITKEIEDLRYEMYKLNPQIPYEGSLSELDIDNSSSDDDKTILGRMRKSFMGVRSKQKVA